jgi:hypothetical protein
MSSRVQEASGFAETTGVGGALVSNESTGFTVDKRDRSLLGDLGDFGDFGDFGLLRFLFNSKEYEDSSDELECSLSSSVILMVLTVVALFITSTGPPRLEKA